MLNLENELGRQPQPTLSQISSCLAGTRIAATALTAMQNLSSLSSLDQNIYFPCKYGKFELFCLVPAAHAKPAMILTGSDPSMSELAPKLTRGVGRDIFSSPEAEQADKSFQEGVTSCTCFSLGWWRSQVTSAHPAEIISFSWKRGLL